MQGNRKKVGSTPPVVYSTLDWNQKLHAAEVRKEDVNFLVMNYLCTEGYKDAAEKFKQESSTEPGVRLESISDRMSIRASLQQGEVGTAIEMVNDLNPEVLDTNPELMFHLKQQQLIELIKQGEIMQALEFAQQEMAPRGEQNPLFLPELEATMALLAFDATTKSPLGFLLDKSQRQKIASELNAAILTSFCQEKDPKLPSLLKLLSTAQAQLDTNKVSYPRMNLKDLHLQPRGFDV